MLEPRFLLLAHRDGAQRSGEANGLAVVRELGAAAVTTVILGAMSYRNGKVYHFDASSGTYTDGNPGWAKKWEALSKSGAKPRHVPGWHAGETGSVLTPEDHQRLAGPWVGGKDPAAAS
jgi:hypothetical protein